MPPMSKPRIVKAIYYMEVDSQRYTLTADFVELRGTIKCTSTGKAIDPVSDEGKRVLACYLRATEEGRNLVGNME